MSDLKVNSPDWTPRAIFDAPLRWFQRKDGQIFPQPATEDWHIERMLKDGWREVAGPHGDAPPPPDTRDDEIAELKAKLAALEAAALEGHADAIPSTDGPARQSGQRPDRRPGQR